MLALDLQVCCGFFVVLSLSYVRSAIRIPRDGRICGTKVTAAWKGQAVERAATSIINSCSDGWMSSRYVHSRCVP